MPITGLMQLASVAGTWLQNVSIPNVTGTGVRLGLPYTNWPHLFDVYIPSTPVQHCFVLLGGAGDTKAHYAFYLDVLNSKGPGGTTQPNWPLLNFLGAMVVIPQAQHCDGQQSPTNLNATLQGMGIYSNPDLTLATPPTPTLYCNAPPSAKYPAGISTWQNGYMNSGWQDMTGAFGTFGNAGGFIYDLNRYIVSTYAPARIYLGGHSNGGFMANRWWMEGADIFDGYFATSGLAATNLAADPVASANKTKFMWTLLGQIDTTIGIANQGRSSNIDAALAPYYHLFDSSLLRPTAETSTEDLEDTHEGPWTTLLKRVAGTSGETVDQAAFEASATPPTNTSFPPTGNIMTARYNSSKLVLRVLTASDHHLPTLQKCLGVYSVLQTFTQYLTSIGQ